MSKKTFLIGLVAAFVLFSEVVTPWLASFWLDSALAKVMPSRQHQVSARSFPGVTLWQGQFDNVAATAEEARLDGLTLREVRITIADARLDMGHLVSSRRVTVRTVKDMDIVIKVTEKDLAEYLGKKVKEVKNPTVKILTDKIQIRSDVDLGILKLAVGVDGKVVVDAQSIRFRSDRLEVNNAGGINFGAVFAEIPLVDLTRLPFQVAVRKVVMEPGILTIYADNR